MVDVSYTEEEREYFHGRHFERSLDLGHGVRADFYTNHSDGSGQYAGLLFSHIHDDEQVCEGAVTFDTETNRDRPGPKWVVQQFEPLTITPSIRVQPCGLHGFIRGGEWVPA